MARTFATTKTFADTETGEVYDLVAVERSTRTYVAGGWFKGMSNALEKIADSEDLTDGDTRVLMKLFARLDWENYLHINVSELAREMGRDRSGVSHSIKRLEAEGIIFRGPKVGRAFTFRLNPNVALKTTDGDKGARRVQREIEKRNWSVVAGGQTEGEPAPVETASDAQPDVDVPLF